MLCTKVLSGTHITIFMMSGEASFQVATEFTDAQQVEGGHGQPLVSLDHSRRSWSSKEVVSVPDYIETHSSYSFVQTHCISKTFHLSDLQLAGK